MTGGPLARPMRARCIGLLTLLFAAPLAAGTGFGDDTGDERIVVRVGGGFVTVDPRAADIGCAAPGADITALSISVSGNDVVLRLRLVEVGASPHCRGRELGTANEEHLMELENERWTLRARAGDTCGGAWTCASLSRHGGGSFVETSTGATATVSGNVWEVRMPMVGRTAAGQSYDLRGETFRTLASSEQVSTIGSLRFFDAVSASSVTLR